MARNARTYRKVEPDMWMSDDFRALSAPKPNAQTLWQYLLTGPRTIAIPGVVVARARVMASDLDWSDRAFAKVMAEIVSRGMAEVDEERGIVVLTKALIADGRARDTAHPGSPNGVKAWVTALLKLPACALRDTVAARIARLMDLIGGAFPSHFAEAMGESCTDEAPIHAPSNAESIPHSGIRYQVSGNSEISLPRAREAEGQADAEAGAESGAEAEVMAVGTAPALTPVVAPAFAPMARLVHLAIDQLNAARAAIDPDAPPIAAIGDDAGVRSLCDRLRPISAEEREPTLLRAIGVLVAWVRSEGKPVGELRLGQLAGERSWARWLADTPKSIQRAAMARRDGARGHAPAPTSNIPTAAETAAKMAAQREHERRVAAEREATAAELAAAKAALGIVGGVAKQLGGRR